MPPTSTTNTPPQSAEDAAVAVDPRDAAVPREVLDVAFAEARRDWRWRPNVLGIHWGFKRVGGNSTPRRALVVTVAEKLPRGDLGRLTPFPHELKVSLGGREFYIPVDVDVLDVVEKQAEVRPGNGAKVEASQRGVLSALVREGEGYSAYLSGHVAGAPGQEVTALSFGKRYTLGKVAVGRFCNGTAVDAAVVEGVPQSVADKLDLEPRTVRELDKADLGVAVGIQTSQTDDLVWSSVHDVFVTASFGKDGKMYGLIRLARKISDKGDSGAPALDVNGNLVGFVIGVSKKQNNPQTYLLSANRGLSV